MKGTPSRPLVFVDVDGVLNLWQPPFPADVIEHAWFSGEEPVRLRARHGVWLSELAAVADLVWATAWPDRDRARLAESLALPAFAGSISLPDPPFPPSSKVPAIARYAGDRPVAWLDDQLTDEAGHWAEHRAAATLLVPVDPATGLLRRHCDDVASWVRSQQH